MNSEEHNAQWTAYSRVLKQISRMSKATADPSAKEALDHLSLWVDTARGGVDDLMIDHRSDKIISIFPG